MLEPLTAIGLASNILQVVDFGSKLLTAGYSAYKASDGASEHVARVETVYADLEKLIAKLAGASTSFNNTPSEDEVALKELSRKSLSLARELLELLGKFKAQGKGLRRAWNALRNEIVRTLKADKLDSLQRALQSIRSEIGIRILNVLRNNQSDLQLSLKSLVDGSAQSHIDSRNQIQDVRDEAISAIEQLTNKFQHLDMSTQTNQDVNTGAINRLEAAIALACNKLDKLNRTTQAIATSDRVLESLHYNEIKVRDFSISEAYEGTYKWIFDEQRTGFRKWLEGTPKDSAERLFWMHGKAGSGKSTLMRFIETHESTKTALEQWSGDDKLVIVSFYFWTSGLPLQKTQQGLLRSLLFQILRQFPRVIQIACPRRWAGDAFFHQHPDPWTEKELTAALNTVLDHLESNEKTKICILLDGLDELDDKDNDHFALIRLVHRLMKHSQLKICVSSRPWPIFMNELEVLQHQQVELHSLTREDMRTYIRGMLVEDPRFGRRLAQEPRLGELVEQVQGRSSGVFLWVYLAVRSLLKGLSDRDNIEQLFDRLSILPTDLRKFFHQMIENIDEAHRREAARVLLLSCASFRHLPVGPLHFLEMYRRENRFALRLDLQPMPRAIHLQWEDNTADRIHVWCKDLLQVDRRLDENYPRYMDRRLDENYPRYMDRRFDENYHRCIRFTHRTVLDFLKEQETQNFLEQFAGHEFHCRDAISQLYLAWIKTLGHQQASRSDLSHEVVYAIDYFMQNASRHDFYDHEAPVADIDELNRVCSRWPWIDDRFHWTSLMPIFSVPKVGDSNLEIRPCTILPSLIRWLLFSYFKITTDRMSVWEIEQDLDNIVRVLVRHRNRSEKTRWPLDGRRPMIAQVLHQRGFDVKQCLQRLYGSDCQTTN